ncbi:MAG: pantetheine-phosphate adenylyltransferase [Clostridia bacterium]|nr:pantetheine-phosphate adenylyltransferase [Clostridia bacterium]MBQ8972452.1 pantetheine-phosphate adenylyltransferase [Clostridia bacterium]
MKAVYAGSFSPPTLGHLDIIERAAGLFDELIVAVLSQQAKRYLFSPAERLSMLADITRDLSNVRLCSDDGLLVDVVHREGANVIVRGVRNAQDLAFEMQVAQANRQIGGVETVFLCSRPEYSLISSTIVRDCAAHGAPIRGMVPAQIEERIYRAFAIPTPYGKEGL